MPTLGELCRPLASNASQAPPEISIAVARSWPCLHDRLGTSPLAMDSLPKQEPPKWSSGTQNATCSMMLHHVFGVASCEVWVCETVATLAGSSYSSPLAFTRATITRRAAPMGSVRAGL